MSSPKPPSGPMKSGPTPIKEGSSLPPPSGAAGKRLFPKSAPRRQVAPAQKPGVTIIGVVFCVIFIGIGWYFMVIRPSQLKMAAELAATKVQLTKAEDEIKEVRKVQEEKKVELESKGGLSVRTEPRGAKVTVGTEAAETSPADFKDLPVGKKSVRISRDGYDDEVREVEVTANAFATLEVKLSRSKGSLQLKTVGNLDADYTLIEGANTIRTGKLPGTLGDLSVGNYELVSRRGEYEIRQKIQITKGDANAVTIEFAYGSLNVQTTPPGAHIIRSGKDLGVTPAQIAQVQPGDFELSFQLKGYRPARTAVKVEANKPTTVQMDLLVDRDFTASNGTEMVYLPSGYWAGKYEITESEFNLVSRGKSGASRKPATGVNWNQAVDFCRKLTEADRAAKLIPAGTAYRLPFEREWIYYVGDATLDESITSRDESRRSIADVGTLKPNKYGLYDVRGNAWEWCADKFADSDQVRSIRGGGWLTFKPEDLDIDTRQGAGVNYADKFVGFRIVLSPEK